MDTDPEEPGEAGLRVSLFLGFRRAQHLLITRSVTAPVSEASHDSPSLRFVTLFFHYSIA
jgi:hypothetical protein